MLVAEDVDRLEHRARGRPGSFFSLSECGIIRTRLSAQREDGDKPASTADAGRGEAAANVVVPKNSVGSAQIKNRSVNFKDLSIRARVKLARDAQVEPPLPGTSGEDLTAFKSCVNKYLREVGRFLNGTRELAPSHRACP